MIFSKIRKKADEFIHALKRSFDEIKKSKEKLSRLKDLWTDERFDGAKALFFKNILRLIKSILPKKGKAHLSYGALDPFKTGNMANMYLLFSPILSEWLDFEPVFNRETLSADVDIKGKIRLFTVAIVGIKIFFNRKLRYLYKKSREILEV